MGKSRHECDANNEISGVRSVRRALQMDSHANGAESGSSRYAIQITPIKPADFVRTSIGCVECSVRYCSVQLPVCDDDFD